jgi:uncharacterized MAPEG superfamily protein
MNALIDHSLINPYLPALLALAVVCLAVQLQSMLTAPLAFLRKQQAPGMPLQGDHSLLSFRVLRTHLNSVESLAPFGFSLLLAMLLAASANWVNGLAIAHAAFRLLYWAVYYSGIGKVAGGIRTLCFVGGLSCNLVLLLMALYAAVS